LLAQQTSNEMAAADLLLDGMLERIAVLGVDDPDALRREMAGEGEFRDLSARKKALPQIDVATVTDDQGNVVNFTRSYPAPKINLADRDYFRVHRERRDRSAFVSLPVRNRGNGTWTFYLSRRIEARDGRFLGTVLVGLSSRRLSDFFSKINLGDDATVTLYRRDFAVLARWPHVDAQMGTINRGGSSFEIVERQRRDDGVVVVDTPRPSAGGARVRRMGAVRTVPLYPLLINVTVTERLFLSQWRSFAWQLAGIGAVCIAAVMTVFAILLRDMRRRDASMRRQRALQHEADAANRAKSDFLAMISHEIRTPLTAVIGFAEQLEHAGGVDEAAELGGIIARNGHSLLALINDILDMSKMETGHLALERVPFAPGEALAGVRSLMAGQARQRGIGFDARLAPDCPAMVLGDPTRWRQIVLNLVSNAIKFTERGEVSVQVWYEPGAVRHACRVADTGIGMDAAQLERLFKPFEQADSSIARRFGGTGLGLYLVRQLAHSMGGAVAVDSRPGEGTRITVTVHAPAAPVPVAPPVRAVDHGCATALAGRVLLVEDGDDNRRLVAAMLRQRGLDVVCAADGQQGVECAMAGAPDLVLMDIQMPVLDGLAATARLRALGFHAPIVALTANVMAHDRARYQAAGFDACLAKPVDRDAFDGLLARYLPRARPPAGVATLFTDLPEFAAIQAAFFDNLRQRLARMETAWACDDRATLQLEAHTLKGSAPTFGYPDVGRAAAALERASRDEAMPAVRAALDTLCAAAAAERPTVS
jgi:signal transduction histidine kinase/CheY-like chemotaxis protein